MHFRNQEGDTRMDKAGDNPIGGGAIGGDITVLVTIEGGITIACAYYGGRDTAALCCDTIGCVLFCLPPRRPSLQPPSLPLR